jgi:hypothetical protein
VDSCCQPTKLEQMMENLLAKMQAKMDSFTEEIEAI